MANSPIAAGYSLIPCETCRTTTETEAQDNSIDTAHLIESAGERLGHGERLYLAAWQEAEREGLE